MLDLVERVRAPRATKRVTVSGVKFPTTMWRGPELRGVDFLHCDLTGLRLRGSLFRKMLLTDCLFQDVELPSLRNVTIANCRFLRATLGHFHKMEGCRIQDTHFDGCRFDTAQFVRSEFLRVDFNEVRAMHPHFSKCQLRETRLAGSATKAVFSGCVFDEVDLSALHLRDSSLEGEFLGNVLFPTYPDSFVVRHQTLVSIEPDLDPILGPTSRSFYRWYVAQLPRLFVVVDDSLFSFAKLDFAMSMTEVEASAVVAALYPLRIQSSAVTQ